MHGKKYSITFTPHGKNYGEKSYSVGTVLGEPNNVYVINEWESVEKFNTFRNSTELHNAMKLQQVCLKNLRSLSLM